MRWTQKTFALIGVALLSSGSLQAVPAANLKENYQSIIERNPFGLKPPAPPATNNVVEKDKPKVEIFLTGMTAVDFPRLPKQAYFVTREAGKKDPTYYALNEGDGKDGIQVLNIDAQNRKVRIKMDNRETTLSFDSHSVPVAAGKPLPAVPGAPGLPQPGQAIPPPGQPQPLPNAAAQPAQYDANGQPVYNQNAAAAGDAIAQRYGTQTTSGTGLRQIPSRRMRGGNQNGGGGAPPPMGGGEMLQQPQGQPADVAEEYLRSHLNRAVREREGVPMPPLPNLPSME